MALARVVATTPLGEDFRFEVDGTPAVLPEAVESALVRVTQTLVGNVVAHSGAESAKVTLTYQPDEVAVDVVDTGRGFEPHAPVRDGAMGLAGAKRRVAQLGGSLAVESAPGAGCGISVRVPIAPGTPNTTTERTEL